MSMERERWDRVADSDRFQSMVGHLLLALGNPASVRGHAAWAGRDAGYDAWVDNLAQLLADAGILDLVPPEMRLAAGPVMVQATIQKGKLVEKVKRDADKARAAGCPTLAVFLHHQPTGKILESLQKLGHEAGKAPVKVVPFPPESIQALLAYAPWVRQRFLGIPALSPFVPLADGLELRPIDFELPFIGRSEDLSTLDRSLRKLAADGGGVFVVAGPSGIGKTRLLAEWARRAEAHWGGHALLACIDARGPVHLIEEQAIARDKVPVVVVETEPSTDHIRLAQTIQPLVDALRAQRARLVLVIVIRSSQLEIYKQRLARQRLWSDDRLLELRPWPDDVVRRLLEERLRGPQEISLRRFISGNPGLAMLVVRHLLRSKPMNTDEAWAAAGPIAEEEARTALGAHGLALPAPFFLPAVALAMPIWTPEAPNAFSHVDLQELFSLDEARLESILEVFVSAGLLQKTYTYRFAPEELGHQLIEEALAGPRGGELLNILDSANWLRNAQVLENLAFAVPSPEHRSAAPITKWFRERTKPVSLYDLPSPELLSSLARAVPKAALEYVDRLLSWFPALETTPGPPQPGRRRSTLFGPKVSISGDELYPVLTGVVLASDSHIRDALRVLADSRRGPERYNNRTPKSALEDWLDPHHATPERLDHAFLEAEGWLSEKSLTSGQLVVLHALVRAIMRREVETMTSDGPHVIHYRQSVPFSEKWLKVRERSIRLVESALRHSSAWVRRVGVGLLYDLGESHGDRLKRSADLEAHTDQLIDRLFRELATIVENERDFGVLSEIQRVTFWRWAAREGSEIQVAVLRAIPRGFLFRLFVTAVDWNAIVDFEEVERRLGGLSAKNERWTAWVGDRMETPNRWGDELAREIVRRHPTPEGFLELAWELERCGLDDAWMARSDRGAPLWLWKLARLEFAYFESVRLSTAFHRLPAWLRFALDDQWLQVSARGLGIIERDTASMAVSGLSAEEVDRALRALRYHGVVLGADRMLEMVFRLLAHPDEDVRSRVADDLLDWLLLGLSARESDEATPPRRALVTSIFTRLLVEEPSLRIRGRTEHWLIEAVQHDIEYRERLLEHVDRYVLGEALAKRFGGSGFLGDSAMRLLEWCAGGDLERWLDWLEQGERLTALAFYFDHVQFGTAIQTDADFEQVVARAERWQAAGRISEDSRRAWLFQVGAQVPEVARAWVEKAIAGDHAGRVRAAEVLAGITERGADMDEMWARLIEREQEDPLEPVGGLFRWTFGDIRSFESRGDEDPPVYTNRRARLARLRERLSSYPRSRALIDETSERLERAIEGWRRRRAER